MSEYFRSPKMKTKKEAPDVEVVTSLNIFDFLPASVKEVNSVSTSYVRAMLKDATQTENKFQKASERPKSNSSYE